MKSTQLKSIIENEMLIGPSEMTQRFQHLRSFGLLPKNRGQAARDLSPDEIINGIISVMDTRPGFAGLVVKCTKSLKSVRGINHSYRGAKNLGEALCLLLKNSEDLIELKVKGIENDDRGVPPYAYGGRAQISYNKNGKEKISYYDPRESLSTENSMDAVNYNARNFKASFEREYVLKGDIFKKIQRYLEQEQQQKELMKYISSDMA